MIGELVHSVSLVVSLPYSIVGVSDTLTVTQYASHPIPETSGGFRAARLPGQATRAARAVGLWVEKYPVPPPNRQLLDWSVVLTNDGSAPSSHETI